MRIRILVLIAIWFVLIPFPLHAQNQPIENGVGWVWYYDGMANNPGLCVIKVDQRVVRYRVECTQPGWETVIWEGLPNPGDYIDTLGANWVKVQAFYSFPPGEHQLVGIGVHVKHAEYPPQWTKAQRLRNTNTIRTWKPDWDFTFRDMGMSFAPCLRRAEESHYRVTGPWGGPRLNGGTCKAVEGDWDWFNGGRIHLEEGGSATGYSADGKGINKGRWKCIDASSPKIEIQWEQGGWRDTLRLSSDGNKLEGENQNNAKIWGVRTRLWQFADCAATAGTWKWFNGGTVIIDDQGGATGYDKGSDKPNPGKWRCVNGSPVTIQIQWVKGGWLDTLTLSSDGQKLEGRNQQNSRVWGERSPG